MTMSLRGWAAVALGLAGALVSAATGAAQPATGAQDFAAQCAACHQRSGLGVPGAFPALKGSKVLQGDPRTLAGVVLYGQRAMPPFKDSLTDSQLAAIVSYARGAWGNTAPPVAPAVFGKARVSRPPPPAG